jgi:hypothetical protein
MKCQRSLKCVKILLSLFLVLGVAIPAWCEKPNTLDFSGEVIEGQLKKPKLMINIDTSLDDLTSIIHLRENFNDFHAVDQKKRLRFIKK